MPKKQSVHICENGSVFFRIQGVTVILQTSCVVHETEFIQNAMKIRQHLNGNGKFKNCAPIGRARKQESNESIMSQQITYFRVFTFSFQMRWFLPYVRKLLMIMKPGFLDYVFEKYIEVSFAHFSYNSRNNVSVQVTSYRRPRTKYTSLGDHPNPSVDKANP